MKTKDLMEFSIGILNVTLTFNKYISSLGLW
ncbi:hypothetical protein IWX76_000168 [Pedobacter sp. CAN_A7]